MEAVITVIGRDAVGILAKVCTGCAEVNVNVEEVSQRILRGTFAMIMLVDLSAASVDFTAFSEKMGAIGAQLGVDIRLDYGGCTACCVMADRRDAELLCLHLLSNALRACGTGGKVQLTLRRCESFWKLTVLDDGCGLPETSREAWLENRRCFLGGAGLGLLLCRECCRRMGWDLQVEQRAPEKGTRAVVTIPLCDEPMPEPTVELRSDCSPVRTQQQYQLRNMLVRELRTMPERGGTEDP